MITKPIVPLIIAIPVILILFGISIYSVTRRKTRKRYKLLAGFRVFVILLMAFLINLRIMDKKFNATVEMKNLDVLFVVDSTISMWAEDYNKKDPRMKGVQKDVEYIIDELTGSNFGLIRFDNRAQILAPFTQDHETVKDAFSTIKMPDRYYAKGSSLNTSYDDMKALLESSNKKQERMTILFFISDGEITDGSQLRSFADLSDLVDAGAVLGYGTEKGGKMKADDYGSILYDPQTGQDALSIIDENNLQQVAKDFDIDYIHMKDTSNVKYLVESIKSGSSLTVEKGDSVSYEDTYYWYAIPLIIMLLVELVLFIRRGRL